MGKIVQSLYKSEMSTNVLVLIFAPMKNLTFSFMLMCLAAQSANAQKFYIKAGTGYAFPLPGQKMDQYGYPAKIQVIRKNGSVVDQVKNASFTSGIQGIVGGGYMLSPNLGIELAASLNITSPTYTQTVGYNQALTRHAYNTILMMPSLVMQTNYANVNIYTRTGLTLPISTPLEQITSIGYTSVPFVPGSALVSFAREHYTWKLKNYFSLGFTAAMGLKVNLSKHTAVFGEASMLYLSPSLKEQTLEFAEINGQTIEPSMVKTTPTTFYFNRNGPADPYKTPPTLPQSFSNLSASVGISYQLKSRANNDKH